VNPTFIHGPRRGPDATLNEMAARGRPREDEMKPKEQEPRKRKLGFTKERIPDELLKDIGGGATATEVTRLPPPKDDSYGGIGVKHTW
jgi:hypothetical protein